MPKPDAAKIVDVLLDFVEMRLRPVARIACR
jgi:hypothetical protein